MYKQLVNKFEHVKQESEGGPCHMSDSGFGSGVNILVSCEITSEVFNSGLPDPKTGPFIDDSSLLEALSNLKIEDVDDSKNNDTLVGQNQLGKRASVGNFLHAIPSRIYQARDSNGYTYLHSAIAAGYADAALFIIRTTPNPQLLNTLTDNADAPLHLAVKTGQWRIARWLVVAGADPCPRDSHGDSPLHIAARTGDIGSVRAILHKVDKEKIDAFNLRSKACVQEPCDLDQWNHVGQTCVHVAAIHNQVEVLRELVNNGANVNAQEGTMGFTALHYAVQKSHKGVMQFLLQCKNVDANIETYGGLTVFDLNRQKKGILGDDDDNETDESDDED